MYHHLRLLTHATLLSFICSAAMYSAQAQDAKPAEAPPAPAATEQTDASLSAIEEAIESKKASDEIIYRTNLGRAEDVAILIQQGASPNDTNEQGVPLIALAASRTDGEGMNTVKTLLEAGAAINKQDIQGQTPLFYAARYGNADIVKYLLEQNANFTLPDKTGKTVRNIAFESQQNSIIEQIDSFALSKNDAIKEGYIKTNSTLEERYRTYRRKLEKEQAEQSRHDHTSERTLALQNDSLINHIKVLIYNLSFSSCAASYWKFCADARQPTELGARGVANNVAGQRNRVISITSQLVNKYGISEDTIKTITELSKLQAEMVLASFTSNEMRREQGIGRVDDMNERCNTIANRWNGKRPE
jgi:hypothetical protein